MLPPASHLLHHFVGASLNCKHHSCQDLITLFPEFNYCDNYTIHIAQHKSRPRPGLMGAGDTRTQYRPGPLRVSHMYGTRSGRCASIVHMSVTKENYHDRAYFTDTMSILEQIFICLSEK